MKLAPLNWKNESLDSGHAVNDVIALQVTMPSESPSEAPGEKMEKRMIQCLMFKRDYLFDEICLLATSAVFI